MATVYILQSIEKNKFYIGSCKDLYIRLEEHKSKVYKNSFTSHNDDWKLFFSIENLSYTQARNIEKHIKKMKSKTYINNLTRYPEMAHNLKDRYSE